MQRPEPAYESPGAERARALVLAHGWNATAYQILNPGIQHWISPESDAVVGYVPATTHPGGRLAMWVAAGEPVCAPDAVERVAEAFEAAARDAGCRACWFGAEERLRAVRSGRAGFSEVLLGAQPVWDPHRWPDILSDKASLRAQHNRSHNKGVRVSLHPPEYAIHDAALHRCLREWLGSRGLPPLHFLVEPFTLDALGDRRLFVAEQEGETIGFLVLTPVPARDGWLVEQIVRGDKAPNGTATLLLDAAMRAAAEAGSRYLTLGLSPLSTRASIASPNPAWLRPLLGWMRAHVWRFYDFGGLDAFKAKFVPDRWDPITAITNTSRPNARTLYAIADAFAGPRTPIALVTRALSDAVRDEARRMRNRLAA